MLGLGLPIPVRNQAGGGNAFNPAQISGLVAAWRTDVGVASSGGNVSSVASAYGLAANNLSPTTGAPTVPTVTAPGNKALIRFTKASTQFMNAQSAVSGIATTGFTVATVISAQDISANMCVVGQSSAATNQIGVQLTNGNIRIKIGAGTITNVACSPNLSNNGLHLLVVTYDAATVNVYIDGILAGTNASFVNQPWAFSQIGAANGTAPFDGYLGPILIYSRALTSGEIASIFSFLDSWRGYNYYFDSAAGSDSSTTSWYSGTPWQNLSKANTFTWVGEETLAPKGGQIHRQSANNNVTTAGLSATRKMALDGALWGAGRADIRCSIAPTGIASAGGGVYTFTAATKPNTFVFYAAGGVVAFGAGNTLNSSMQRLTENTGTPTAPGVGEWGYDTTTCYVNVGQAVVDGDIEYIPTGSTSAWSVTRDNWTLQNAIFNFRPGTVASANANTTFSNLDVNFSLQDGIDASASGTATNLVIQNCIVRWSGIGYTGTGGSNGDGYSFHNGATVTVTNCQAWWCGKQGVSWHDDVTLSINGLLNVGQTGFRALTGGGGASGVATLKNCIAWVMTNANSLTDGIVNESSLATINAYGCTVYSQSSQGTGVKGTGGPITGSDIIIKGFATDKSASNVTVDHVCTSGISTANIVAGNGNLINTDPLLTDAVNYDLSLLGSSPCIGAGIAVAGLTTDFAGVQRRNPPSIGAYEL